MGSASYLSKHLGICPPEASTNRQQTVAKLDCSNAQVLATKIERLDSATYAAVVRECGNARALQDGKRIHAQIKDSGRDKETLLANLLIQMYGKCGSLDDACRVFDDMQHRNVFSWTIMIAAYMHNRDYQKAIDFFQRMDAEKVVPDVFTYSTVLGACAKVGALAQGKAIHARIVASGLESDTVVGNALVNMYAKCICLEDSWRVFQKMSKKDGVSWNAIVGAYVHHNYAQEALSLYRQMQLEGVHPDAITFASILSACSNLGALAEGKAIHARIIAMGFDSVVAVQNALINMYGKCKSLDNARKIFETSDKQCAGSWTAVIGAYAQHGYGQIALQLFQKMDLEGVEPNVYTFISMFSVCASLGSITSAKLIHQRFLATGFKHDVVAGTALLNMYAKCMSITDARGVFDSMEQRNVVTWNAMIAAFVQSHDEQAALELYRRMDMENVKPDVFTFSSILAACSSLADGKLIHAHIAVSELESDIILQNALINMYSKSGSVVDAHTVFEKMHRKDAVSWNAMIGASVRHGHLAEALDLFKRMDSKPDVITFASILTACANLGVLSEGKDVHSKVIVSGLETVTMVQNALVNMYAKCGSLEDAMSVFSRMHQRDVVTWTAMIAAYVQHGLNLEAIQLYRRMALEGVEPDVFTFACVLGAFSGSEFLQEGRTVHKRITACGYEADVVVGTALVNMYSKCGSLDAAREFFDEMRWRNVVSWNAMITGYVQGGCNKEALSLYQQMEEEAEPDDCTFASILVVCSSLGDIAQGKQVHEHVVASGFDEDPLVQNALVDMYGKCGDLYEAREIFDGMKRKDVVSWTSIITAYAQCGHGSETLELVHLMNMEGVEPDGITFTSILHACSHAGLLDEVGDLYSSMITDHGIAPIVEHYLCVMDLLGRAGWLKEAEDVLSGNALFEADAVAWTSLLSACKLHNDIERGARVAEHLRELSQKDDAPYVILSNILLSR